MPEQRFQSPPPPPAMELQVTVILQNQANGTQTVRVHSNIQPSETSWKAIRDILMTGLQQAIRKDDEVYRETAGQNRIVIPELQVKRA
jgi:hypothetical protein